VKQPALYQRSLKWLEKRLKRPSLHTARLRGLEKTTREIVSIVYRPLPKVKIHAKLIRILLIGLVVVLVTFISLSQYGRLVKGVGGFVGALKEPRFLEELSLLPQALLASLARLSLAYVASLAWTLPLAAWLAWRGAAVFSILTVLASIPATALFPLIINVTIHLPYGLLLTSIILTMTGMQWYILFNLIGGFRSVPSDIVEAARSFGLRRLSLWRKVMLPAVMPALITGSITGWGGGWNALIVSEYINYGGETYTVLGLGSMLDRAAYELGNLNLLLIVLITMSSTIVLMNRVIWRRAYHYTLDRYRFE
jgi:NitT/TauT family transport system permease protein